MAHADWCGEPCRTCKVDCWLRNALDCLPDRDCMLEDGSCNLEMVCYNIRTTETNKSGDLKKLGNTRLSEKRREKGLSQSQLAKLSGMPVRSLQNLEIGTRDINKCAALAVYQLAKVLECKIEDLLEIENE